MDFDRLPSNWRWSTIVELAAPNTKAIVSGPFGSNIGSRFFVESGVPVIRGNNLTQDLSKFVDDGFVFVTPEKAAELGNVDAIEDDLIFTAAGTIGQVGIIPKNSKYKKYIISNKQLRARLDKKKVIPTFAFYWFSSPNMVEYIEQQNTGSTIPLINLSVLKRLPIPIPNSLDEQLEIVNILSSLDNKIDLNQRMNDTLEGIAQALFKSWFVDFDPVKAKSEGREPESMDDVIAALFPSRFTDSPLGLIPEGWTVGTLERVSFLNPESWSHNNTPTQIEYVDLANTKWGTIESTQIFSWEDAPSRAQRILRKGDTIVGTVRTGTPSRVLCKGGR